MDGMSAVEGAPLRLVRQAKVADLLADVAGDLDRFEASGLVLVDGLLWIIFDNLPHLAAVDPSLTPGDPSCRLVRCPGPAAGYEDIAHDATTGRRYVLIESARGPDGGYRPQIDEFDAGWRRIARRWVDLAVERPNKGLEGLTCVRRGGRCHLLALSESNGGRAGPLGRRPGHGLVHVLVEGARGWDVVDRIRLPAELPFVDYSGLSVQGDRVAVVSQESSALWVGRLDERDWHVAGAGRVYPFPRDERGRTLYGTVEGVCWLGADLLAVASDRAKRQAPRRFRATAESVHVFALPAGGLDP